MNERIKTLRNYLKLSQELFGARLGVQKSQVSRMESGKNNVTESMQILICKEFDVSEEWLQKGTGEMFNHLPFNNNDLYLSELLESCKDNPFCTLIKDIMTVYVNLDTKSKEMIIESTRILIDGLKKRED